jgi:DNA repair protein RadC
LREIGELMGVRVLDHIIFGDNRYVSFVDDGYWDK